MSWSQRIFSMMAHHSVKSEQIQHAQTLSTTSGLNNERQQTQNYTLHAHDPSLPLEYVGVKGEYDLTGLAKRVALALDADPDVSWIKTLCIIQHGARISFLGKVASAESLNKVIALANQVEGTREVDVSQVVIENSVPEQVMQPMAS
ncbi:MAG: phospholipid-binding protein [Synechococcales cyanobacterium C42_A2020_086]|jgi:hypothetical protein|nr:phospholipid-binding protein [Synechococcales cyanobacterium M58_A2018_015]MBF2074848.1 phospholipid-binding protein [Synechococcales cyanobacterium C42_A2020_086]